MQAVELLSAASVYLNLSPSTSTMQEPCQQCFHGECYLSRSTTGTACCEVPSEFSRLAFYRWRPLITQSSSSSVPACLPRRGRDTAWFPTPRAISRCDAYRRRAMPNSTPGSPPQAPLRGKAAQTILLLRHHELGCARQHTIQE
jgi:hypothetical protein